MQDDVLNNILNILQNDSGNQNNAASSHNTSNHNLNDDLQGILLKMLLSGGFNNIFNTKQREQETLTTTPRTINLENYKRLD